MTTRKLSGLEVVGYSDSHYVKYGKDRKFTHQTTYLQSLNELYYGKSLNKLSLHHLKCVLSLLYVMWQHERLCGLINLYSVKSGK
jgi:hypothetical protein